MCFDTFGWADPACKKWGDGGRGHWLVRMQWRPAGWSVFLSLLIFPCTINSKVLFWHRLTGVVPKKGHKMVVVYVYVNCFSAMMWDKLYEMFAIVSPLS